MRLRRIIHQSNLMKNSSTFRSLGFTVLGLAAPCNRGAIFAILETRRFKRKSSGINFWLRNQLGRGEREGLPAIGPWTVRHRRGPNTNSYVITTSLRFRKGLLHARRLHGSGESKKFCLHAPCLTAPPQRLVDTARVLHKASEGASQGMLGFSVASFVVGPPPCCSLHQSLV